MIVHGAAAPLSINEHHLGVQATLSTHSPPLCPRPHSARNSVQTCCFPAAACARCCERRCEVHHVLLWALPHIQHAARGAPGRCAHTNAHVSCLRVHVDRACSVI